MSCNGCRILRKGCNENCILRQSLCAIESAQAQANATLFVAKFFGRAGLMSFLSSVPEHQRPGLFQSLLFEACGRTVNPVNGAVGLLWTGNWHVCESAVATVLRGGSIHPMPELFSVGTTQVTTESDNSSEAINCNFDEAAKLNPEDLKLGLTRSAFMADARRSSGDGGSSNQWTEKLIKVTSTDVSETTTLESSSRSNCSEKKLLRLFM
ncbi:LOB domain-containing protein 37 [Lactuca sativa]|uniref:LOB domain-containing protein 37 n=1 Tax=Lactuca sativa TaxID=4236 RepID=UPI000CC7CF96|nr:LOB domain-containing protein 37 [Lactuca sativa]